MELKNTINTIKTNLTNTKTIANSVFKEYDTKQLNAMIDNDDILIDGCSLLAPLFAQISDDKCKESTYKEIDKLKEFTSKEFNFIQKLRNYIALEDSVKVSTITRDYNKYVIESVKPYVSNNQAVRLATVLIDEIDKILKNSKELKLNVILELFEGVVYLSRTILFKSILSNIQDILNKHVKEEILGKVVSKKGN